ncbi:MAG: hypothetical protein ACLP52_26855 [Streptosporangiaceae bacterium]
MPSSGGAPGSKKYPAGIAGRSAVRSAVPLCRGGSAEALAAPADNSPAAPSRAPAAMAAVSVLRAFPRAGRRFSVLISAP